MIFLHCLITDQFNPSMTPSSSLPFHPPTYQRSLYMLAQSGECCPLPEVGEEAGVLRGGLGRCTIAPEAGVLKTF